MMKNFNCVGQKNSFIIVVKQGESRLQTRNPRINTRA